MKKAVQKAVRPTVADLVLKLNEYEIRLTDEQREQVAAVFAHNDLEPSLKRRIGAVPLHRMLVEHYGYTLSRHTLERDAIRAFGRQSWTKP